LYEVFPSPQSFYTETVSDFVGVPQAPEGNHPFDFLSTDRAGGLMNVNLGQSSGGGAADSRGGRQLGRIRDALEVLIRTSTVKS
jgi:hypothetical protein